MTPVDLASWITAGGVVISVGASLLITGIRWGRLEARQKMVEKNQEYLQANMITRDQGANMLERLARIEGMFELKLKE